jgi:UPF0755 protein
MAKLSKAGGQILFVAILIIIVAFWLYARSIYQAISLNQTGNWSPALIRLIDRLSGHQPAVKQPAPKAEETIKVLEGWTTVDIAKYLANFHEWSPAGWLKAAGQPQTDYRQHPELAVQHDWATQFPALQDKPKYYGLEGYLFPDTYRIFASSTETEIVEKMLTNFEAKLTPQMRADIKAQGKTVYEIVTMASLIEKEAPLNYQTGDNRAARIISGIFWRRLKNGQALESDASLSYVLGDKSASHSGAELNVNSPYNTYRHRGLPPGPICNPGSLALAAAIYPLATNYNYFLTPAGTTTVIYAQTYAEHLRNKYHYLP